LKGSTFNRRTGIEKKTTGTTTMKDIDYMETEERIVLDDPDLSKNLRLQMINDVKLLEKNNLIDYSLLLIKIDEKAGIKR
jgi:hypothetical protein